MTECSDAFEYPSNLYSSLCCPLLELSSLESLLCLFPTECDQGNVCKLHQRLAYCQTRTCTGRELKSPSSRLSVHPNGHTEAGVMAVRPDGSNQRANEQEGNQTLWVMRSRPSAIIWLAHSASNTDVKRSMVQFSAEAQWQVLHLPQSILDLSAEQLLSTLTVTTPAIGILLLIDLRCRTFPLGRMMFPLARVHSKQPFQIMCITSLVIAFWSDACRR